MVRRKLIAEATLRKEGVICDREGAHGSEKCRDIMSNCVENWRCDCERAA